MKPYYLDPIGTRSPKVDHRSASDATSDIKNPAQWLVDAFTGVTMGTVAGVTVTPLKALGVATVYACVRVWADTMGCLPLQVCQRQGDQRDIATNHRLYNALMLRPNEEMSRIDMCSAVQSNLSLMSKGYMEVLRDADGDAVGLYPIEASRMDFYRDSRTKKVRYRLMDKGTVFEGKDIVHLRLNTFNGLEGLGITKSARDCIALAVALQENAVKFFSNGSRPSGVLEHPQSLSPEAQLRLQQQFDAQSAGEELYKTLVLEEGLKYTKQRSENKDSQFLEAKEAQNLEICRLFRVPPHKVGITSAKGANIEEENIGFITDGIFPMCERWQQELDFKLLTEEERDQGFCIRFDLSALNAANLKALYDSMAIGRQWGFLNVDDCRRKINMPPLPEGQGKVYLQPLNMADATKAHEILTANKNSTPNKGEGSQKQVS